MYKTPDYYAVQHHIDELEALRDRVETYYSKILPQPGKQASLPYEEEYQLKDLLLDIATHTRLLKQAHDEYLDVMTEKSIIDRIFNK